MFGAPIRYGAGAGARYRDVDVAARVEGASPHALILIMLEELLKALDAMRAAEAAFPGARGGTTQARALSILHGLEAGLDMERGGEIAQSLAKIYREARRLIGGATDRATALESARGMIEEITGAWREIG